MKVLENEFRRHYLKKGIPSIMNLCFSQDDITLELLYRCRNITSQIIQKYGEDYLSLFIRIEQEIHQKEKAQNALHRALNLSKKDFK